jgi:hypothetical protein
MSLSPIYRGGLERAQLVYPDLNLEDLKLIGWGAGQYFRDYFPWTGLNLAYTVCPTAQHAEFILNGVQVRSPDSLKGEDPENTLIIVFSNFLSEIYKQLRLHGRFRVVNGVGFATEESDIDSYKEWSKIFPCLKLERSTPVSAPFGIFTQGPITDITPVCLAKHKAVYPEALHVLVADADEQPKRIESCEPWVDRIVYVPRPENPSCLNRNLMIRSCRHGADTLLEAGVKYSVRARTDSLLTGSVYKAIGALKRREKDGMICIPGNGWKHIPFHFSDMLMVSRSEDLQAFWSCPEDPRSPDHRDFQLASEDGYQTIRRIAPESYLWECYAKRLGLPTESLVDSYSFAKEFIAPLSDDFGHILLKYLPMFQVNLDGGFHPDSKWWEHLKTDFNQAAGHAIRLERSNFTVADFYNARVA